MPTDPPSRSIRWSGREELQTDPLLTREWLVTNGLGGYASGTLSGVATRRYHGLLVAALPAPRGRVMMLNHLAERVIPPEGASRRLGGREHPGRLALHGAEALREFRLDAGLPVWSFDFGEVAIEKRVVMAHRQNTTHLIYRIVRGERTVRLRLRPSLNVRPHDAPVSQPIEGIYTLSIQGDRHEIQPPGDFPALRLHLGGPRAAMLAATGRLRNLFYRVEAERGYPDRGDLWSPGDFLLDLRPDRPACLTVSVEPWETILALSPEEALQAELQRRERLILDADPRVQSGVGAELVLAADAFLITPATRAEETARSIATGDEPQSVIAGYHWFTDWGRDTMIGLDGLTLTTGRHALGGRILRTFAAAIRDGLIPNLYPEGSAEGVYHTADATLWFFQALNRYIERSGDRATLRTLLPRLLEIVELHRRGTRFGIGVDQADGLLRQGAEGYQLTWMDAKVEGWVVTPRRGKAVEINALWYNALRLLEGWLVAESREGEAESIAALADRARESFNRRFWYEHGGYLFDVVDGEGGDDPACRPNQLFAIALPHPILDRGRWEPVVQVCQDRLLTPVGLRSLAPGHPDYKPRYDGDLRARDAAYHQGTVWAWLIGPFVDAWRKLHPEDQAGARAFLEGFVPELLEYGLGSIAEIFDAEPPFTPRGCIAQAWSVAEVLRCWAETATTDPT